MKKYLIILLGLFSLKAYAQSITLTPGSISPQMTSNQRTAISNPAHGMLVYDIGTNSYWFYQQNTWKELPSVNYWQLSGAAGNEIKNTNSGGFWSEYSSGLDLNADNNSNPATSPTNGDGTRLMWIPSRSAFRVGSVAEGYKSWDADSIGLFSFASGYNSKAKGFNSTALGGYTEASGYYATVMGGGGIAAGEFSLATGLNSKALGSISTAIGLNNTAKGDASMALGLGTSATGKSALSLGNYTEAKGDSSTAMGLRTLASGLYALAMGNMTQATARGSTTMGERTIARGSYSTATGFNTMAKAPDGFSTGAYNDTLDFASPDLRLNADRIFQVGNGYYDFLNFNLVRKNAMTILRTGFTGLNNVNSPVAPLHIGNGPNSWERHIRLDYNTSTSEYGNLLYDHQGMKFKTWGTDDNFYFVNKNDVTVATLFENGNMTITGNLTQNSDARLKKDIARLTHSSSKLQNLNGYHYHWLDTERDKAMQTGFFAQEVQKEFPELVKEGQDGYLSVNYIGLIPHLIEAHKELVAQNNELKTRLSELEAKFEKAFENQSTSLK
ncbi:hypothetical protein EGI22_04475 [Lacihabitans sp. LS3-19]|uniref:tail fiber domain-containing protein n=1 Tax=Lacihabitans sp. LS3-19 TaxID=2487335 RepID=UPI0020CF7B30|nr:tail fiber domain-containing protein [Lacihabitans sp. LS3-19]MCP9767154.1 hypothetical protein [Lacihabitans sp. LS3-19]